MSVQQNHYMIMGAKWSYDEFYELPEIKSNMTGCGWKLEEAYRDCAFEGINHHNGLCVISDGMNGEYSYIGYILKKSGNYGDIDDYISEEQDITAEEVSKRIKNEFGIEVECKIHVFTHYR